MDQRKQQHDLRQEDQHRTDTGEDPIGEQVGQQARSEPQPHTAPERAERAVDRVHGGHRPTEDALEQEQHDRGEDHGPGDGVEQHAVEPLGARVACEPAGRDLGDDRVDPGESLLGVPVGRQQHRARPGFRAPQQCAQLRETDPAVPHHTDDRDAEDAAELLQVETPTARPHLVDHRHDQRRGAPELQHLGHQTEAATQRRPVEHHDDRIGSRLVLQPPGEHVADDRLVRRLMAQAVGAGQVENPGGPADASELALPPLDGHSGVVPDLRARAGQRVEQRGLAGVRRPDQRHPQRLGGNRRDRRRGHESGVPRSGFTQSERKSRRRRQIR